MNKRIPILLIFLFLGISYVNSQMPTDGDYTFWNWEDQSLNNWKRKNGNTWININPPFSNVTDKSDLLYQVFQAKDYSKQKGWRIIYAQFDGTYPYFILYNIYRSVVRAFIYNETEFPSSYLMFSLAIENSKVKLLGGTSFASATDVEDGTENANIFTSVINFPGLNTWSAFEVPILFDDRLREHSTYPLSWQFRFSKYNLFNINLKINGTAKPILPNGSNFVGSNSALNNSSNTFEAKYTKYQKRIQDVDKLLDNMHQMANKISDSAPVFLQDYKEMINGLKSATDVVHAASSISSAAGALFGIFNFFSSALSGNNTTSVYAYDFNGTLEGTMSNESNLRLNNLQIPGSGDMDNYKWIPFNCPMGLLNLQKTPTIKATSLYQRYGIHNGTNLYIAYPNNTPSYFWGDGCYNQTLMAAGDHAVSPNHVEQHSGKYRKYKFDEDITLVKQEIEGLSLKEVKFALICKPTGVGKQKYKITSKYLTYHYFYNDVGSRYELAQENLVYTNLCNKQYVIHRFDEENDEVLYGTPYIPMNQFKGVVIEVPEDTEVSLGIMATFTSTAFDTPILFKAMYKLKVQDVGSPDCYFQNGKVKVNTKYGFITFMDPVIFSDKDYYVTEEYTLNTGPNSGTYQGKLIKLLPGFRGVPGFRAYAQQYKGNGNTRINSINYYCNSLLNTRSIKSETTSNENIEKINFKVYPNPLISGKIIHIVGEDEIKSIEIYDVSGNLVYKKDNINQCSIDLSLPSLSKGMYNLHLKSIKDKYSTKLMIIDI